MWGCTNSLCLVISRCVHRTHVVTAVGFTREQQDDFAIASYKRAAAAWEAGRFNDEVVPVEIPQRKGDPKVVSVDEEFTRVSFDKVVKLPPAFDRKSGSVTAANASSLNDGAAVCLRTDFE